VQGPAGPLRRGLDGQPHFFEQRQRGWVRDAVCRAEVESVDAVVPEPRQGAIDEKPADLVADGAVQIETPAAVGEIGPEEYEGLPLDSDSEKIDGQHHR